MRDVILRDLIKNIFPDILTGKIHWTTTDNHTNRDESPKNYAK